MLRMPRRRFNAAAGTAGLVLGAGLRPAFGAGEKPRSGGHLRVAYALEPTSLDPAVGRSGGDIYYVRAMFDALVDADQAGSPSPATSLATGWTIADDPPSITFALRQGVKFHDGTPFDAEAVKFNMDRMMDPATKATPRSSLAPIASVEAVDAHTVRFNLKQPWGPALGTLSDRAGLMSSPTAIRKLGLDYGWNPSGTGPFKLKDVVSGSYVHMVRNEDYWGRDADGNRLPYLDELTIKVINDEKVLVSALQSGEIDVAYLPPRNVDDFEKDPSFHIETMRGGVVGPLLVFNPDLMPTNNPDLRRAVVQAISPDNVNKAVYFNKHVIADAGMYPVGTWAYAKTPSHLPYDVAKAKASLAAGGKPDGFPVNIITWNNPDLQRTAEIALAQLGRIGIKASLSVETVNAATEKFFAGKQTPIFLTTWSRVLEPDYLATTAFKSGGFYNPATTPNPELDKLVAAGAAHYAEDDRKAIYHQITDYTLSNALWHPLIYQTYYAAGAKQVRNLGTLINSDGKMVFKNVWLAA